MNTELENRKIRWGLMGAGEIVDRWMKGAAQVEEIEVAAIASRTMETAQRMAEKHGIPEAVSYEALVARDDIDVIYVSAPHATHKPLAMQAMRAGKPVLVEKPGAVNEADFAEMAACAKENNVFLMEAVWSRFFPMVQQIKDTIAAGKIGRVQTIQSAFAFRVGEDNNGRLTDPMQAGGGLLDVGIYSMNFVKMVLDQDPVDITGLASLEERNGTGQIDGQASFVSKFADGTIAVMSSAVRTQMRNIAYIYGTEGYIEVPNFWKPSVMTICANGSEERIEIPVPQKVEGISDDGYQYEIRHVNECLRQGVKESPIVSWEDTKAILRQCDKLRKDWGLKYPCE